MTHKLSDTLSVTLSDDSIMPATLDPCYNFVFKNTKVAHYSSLLYVMIDFPTDRHLQLSNEHFLGLSQILADAY